MSKVIFFCSPTFGHINPTLPLVKELVSRGEEVLYYNSEKFREKIERKGAFFRLNRYFKEDYNNRGKIYRGPEDAKCTFEDITGIIYTWLDYSVQVFQNIIKEIKNEMPDYIIYDCGLYWGKLVAKRLGIPAISSIPYFAYCDKILNIAPGFVIKDIFWMRDDYLIDKMSTIERLTELSKSLECLFDLEDFNCIDVLECREKLNIVYTSRYFQPYSECFDEGFKFVGPSICPENEVVSFPVEKLKRKPLIYISLGSHTIESLRKYYIDFYKTCFEAFDSSDKQVILVIGGTNKAALGRIPDNFIVEPFVPQLEILQHTDLFITHGGMNSVCEGFYFNVPLTVIPQMSDQFVVAKRVEEIGAGIYIRRPEVSPGELRKAAEKVLSDESVKKEGKKIGDSFRSAGGYERAVDELFLFKEKYGIH